MDQVGWTEKAPSARKPGREPKAVERQLPASLCSASLCIAFALCCSLVTPAGAASLDVVIAGVRSGRGLVRLCLWSGASGFPDCNDPAAPVRRENRPAVAGAMTFHLGALQPGIYAVSVFHDERGDGRIATNFLGIPRDGLGASNNPVARFGPPSFEAAAFRIAGADARITVRIVYP